MPRAGKRTNDVLVDDSVQFSGLLLPSSIEKALADEGYEKPSPIQLAAIPIGRTGSDMVAQAKSGTGKTLVFAIIALERIDPAVKFPQALIIAPTREIAQQIGDVVIKLGKYVNGLSVGVFIGGINEAENVRSLQQGCQIIVGTPGRLKRLLVKKYLDTISIKLLILDEADVLFGEQFLKSIEFISNRLPKERQVLLFSATIPPKLLELLDKNMKLYANAQSEDKHKEEEEAEEEAEESTPIVKRPLVNNPKFVILHGDMPSLEGVKQFTVTVSYYAERYRLFEEKANVVIKLLSKISFNQCIIFCNDRPAAQALSHRLSQDGWPSAFVAGDQSQDERSEAISALRMFNIRILVSTDLISRGIDVERINLVLNMDIPYDGETYLHRVGRSGRFGNVGIAISITTPREREKLRQLVSPFGVRLAELPEDISKDLYYFELEDKEDLEKLKKMENSRIRTKVPTPMKAKEKQADQTAKQTAVTNESPEPQNEVTENMDSATNAQVDPVSGEHFIPFTFPEWAKDEAYYGIEADETHKNHGKSKMKSKNRDEDQLLYDQQYNYSQWQYPHMNQRWYPSQYPYVEIHHIHYLPSNSYSPGFNLMNPRIPANMFPFPKHFLFPT